MLQLDATHLHYDASIDCYLRESFLQCQCIMRWEKCELSWFIHYIMFVATNRRFNSSQISGTEYTDTCSSPSYSLLSKPLPLYNLVHTNYDVRLDLGPEDMTLLDYACFCHVLMWYPFQFCGSFVLNKFESLSILRWCNVVPSIIFDYVLHVYYIQPNPCINLSYNQTEHSKLWHSLVMFLNSECHYSLPYNTWKHCKLLMLGVRFHLQRW